MNAKPSLAVAGGAAGSMARTVIVAPWSPCSWTHAVRASTIEPRCLAQASDSFRTGSVPDASTRPRKQTSPLKQPPAWQPAGSAGAEVISTSAPGAHYYVQQGGTGLQMTVVHCPLVVSPAGEIAGLSMTAPCYRREPLPWCAGNCSRPSAHSL